MKNIISTAAFLIMTIATILAIGEPGQAFKLLPSSAINMNCAYEEQQGLVIMEAENTTSDYDKWILKTDVSNYKGSGHIEFTGNSTTNGPPNSPLVYTFKINQAGTYQLTLRCRKRITPPDESDKSNDAYVRVEGDYNASPNAGNNHQDDAPKSALESDTKLFGGNENSWGWGVNLDLGGHNNKRVPKYVFKAGETYTLVMSGRSKQFNVDRIIFYRLDDYNTSQARSTSNNTEETACDQTSSPPVVSGELKKWHKITITYDGPNTSETASPNPFMDYNLNVTFSHSSGKSYVVPGYYAACGDAANNGCNSGNKWRVHFSPDRTGTWNWQADFRSGTNVAINGGGSTAGFMHGESGSFNISESDKTGRDHRSPALGRLQYVGEHYLRFSGTNADNPNGKWLFKYGPDAPENMMAYDDFDATPNRGNRRKSWSQHSSDYNASDASAYTWDNGSGTEMLGMLKYLSDQGVNVFSFLTFSLSGDDENVFPHLLKVSESVYNGYGDANQWNNGVHHDRFDISKMDQWEKIFEYADKKGLYLHFKTQETENDQRMDGGNVGNERKVYYRELVARYAHHLALNWNTGEENSQTQAQEIAMADYLDQIDPYNHLIVMHTYPGEKNRYTPLLGNNSEYTGASLQSGIGSVHGDVVTWVNNSRNANKKWVIANDEQGPAQHGVGVDDSYPNNQLPSDMNRTDNRAAVRDQVLWGTMLAGGAGVEYYYGYQTGCSDLDCEDHRTRETKWEDGFIAKTFFDTYLQDDLLNMQSADNLTSDNDDYVFADAGKIYAIYLPDGGSTNLNLSGVTGDFIVRWYDPRNGGSLETGSVTAITGGQNRSIGNPPNNNSSDWVVLVQSDACERMTNNSFPGIRNWATYGTASQSSTFQGVPVASRAIDGNTSGYWSSKSVTRTNEEDGAWWQVELQSSMEIQQIVIWNRLDDCCIDRLSNFTVSVLDDQDQVVWSQFYAQAPNPHEVICPFVTGKTVRIALDGIINIGEVQVFGQAVCDGVSKNLSGNINPNATEFYSNFINGNAGLIFNTNTEANFFAENYIQFQNNIEVKQGAQLSLAIEECVNE